MKILEPRNYYKPFDYPWAYDLWMQHESIHWLSRDVNLSEDIRDWNNELTNEEKQLLTNLFRFFTQADVDVACGYANKFLPYFSHKPELAMMMSSFAAREAVHIDAYALLIETLGMPEETYKQFQEYGEMKDKHEYASDFSMNTPLDTLKTLAVYSAFTEGMQLFASFAVLLNFKRNNKMLNMCNIVAWSIKDESLHVEAMTKLFRTYQEEYLATITSDAVRNQLEQEIQVDVRKIASEMVEIEDKFIDLIFEGDIEIEGLTAEEVKQYIRHISNIRWGQLGFGGELYSVERNPLPWIEIMINGVEHTNFFEAKSTGYSKAMTKGTMEEIEW
tara:strand:- start:370 stop:1365 length:996 start_codon:yes stop_codon:yes gene_type:complete